MRTISLRLPDEMPAQLDAEAKARGVTKSFLVRESLEKALGKESSAGAVSCYDLAHDLAGSVKGLPEDLADNPKYMDGSATEADNHLTYGKMILWRRLQYPRKARSRSPKRSGMP
jgi:predicted DNA-binding protein